MVQPKSYPWAPALRAAGAKVTRSSERTTQRAGRPVSPRYGEPDDARGLSDGGANRLRSRLRGAALSWATALLAPSCCFLAGLEIDLERLRGALLRSASIGFVFSPAVALGIGLGLEAAGLIQAPLLVAIILSTTSLGIVIPVLTDAGQSGTTLGQLVIGGSSIADFAAIILLSLFFSGGSSSIGATLLLIGAFVALVVAIGVALAEAEHSKRLSSALRRLQDSSAQIRVRGALLLLIGFAVLAQSLGLEVILGAVMAGAVLGLLDWDRMMTHPLLRTKLQAVGFGVFIPFFFVTSGMQLDVRALFSGEAAFALVPVFLLALLLARGLPAILYRPRVGGRGSVAAGLLQATSLPFIVAATAIGMELGLLSPATGAAMVVAGLLSVVLFPLGALTVMRSAEDRRGS